MDARVKPFRRVPPVAIALLLASGTAAAPKKAPAPPPIDPLLPAAPAKASQTNLSLLPAPNTRMLPAPGDPEFEFGGPLRRPESEISPQNDIPPTTNAPAGPIAAPPTPQFPQAPVDPETDWITADEILDAPLVTRAILPPDSVVVAGLCVRQMKVELKNRSQDRALGIRGVRWTHGLGRTDWVKSLSGTSRHTPAGMVVVERGPGTTEIWFEHGLLLPAETLKFTLPLTPQLTGIHSLEVDFVAAGSAETPWRQQVLIPASQGNATEIFDEPGERSLQARNGQGGIGLLRSSLQADQPVPDVTRLTYRVGLPLARGNWLGQLTGGLVAEQALATAGLRPDEEYLAYFIDPLRAWILVRPADRDARILLADRDTWDSLKGCRIDAAAPDLMCAAPDRSTPALLDPGAFGEITAIQTPWVGRLYNPGKTYLNPDALRAALKVAAERAVPIRVAAIDPNGLGIEEILTFGVTVDAAGRWLKPNLTPAARKMPKRAPQSALAPPPEIKPSP